MKKIIVFASGTGSNAMNIAHYFKGNSSIVLDSVWTNRQTAPVVNIAKTNGLDVFIFNKADFNNGNLIVTELKSRKVDLIVLAGFLWLIPNYLISNFSIVNIHPSLLPKYGGKGMYGIKIHEEVINNKEIETGITIHMVNEEYDSGKVLLQKKTYVLPTDTPEVLQKRVHSLEYKYYPKIIEQLLSEF